MTLIGDLNSSDELPREDYEHSTRNQMHEYCLSTVCEIVE